MVTMMVSIVIHDVDDNDGNDSRNRYGDDDYIITTIIMST